MIDGSESKPDFSINDGKFEDHEEEENSSTKFRSKSVVLAIDTSRKLFTGQGGKISNHFCFNIFFFFEKKNVFFHFFP